ncbi:MAG: hypothetical protein EBR82_32360 [Caulobacteraceae bacterium]|nr:hypothetical protein [Caulobacteraceae bacterium]
MIKIEKTLDQVKVYLPIETLTFDRGQFDLICDNIFLIKYSSHDNSNRIREKSNIEDLNMGHWLCLKNKYQTKFNDPNLKSLDVEYLIKKFII